MRGEGQEGGVTKGHLREVWGVTDMFIVFILVTDSFTLHQTAHDTYTAYCMPILFLKSLKKNTDSQDTESESFLNFSMNFYYI